MLGAEEKMAKQRDDAEEAKIIPPGSAAPNMDETRASPHASATKTSNAKSSKSKRTTNRKKPDATIIDIDAAPSRAKKYLRPLLFGLIVGVAISLAMAMSWSSGLDLAKLWAKVTGASPVEMPIISEPSLSDSPSDSASDSALDSALNADGDLLPDGDAPLDVPLQVSPAPTPSNDVEPVADLKPQGEVADVQPDLTKTSSPPSASARTNQAFETKLAATPFVKTSLPPAALSAILTSGQPLDPYWSDLSEAAQAIGPKAVHLLTSIQPTRLTGLRSASSLMTQISIWAGNGSQNLSPSNSQFSVDTASASRAEDQRLDTQLPQWLDDAVNGLITVRRKPTQSRDVPTRFSEPRHDFVQAAAKGKIDAAVLAYGELDDVDRADLSDWYVDAQHYLAAHQLAEQLLAFTLPPSLPAIPNQGNQ
jgi:hypothetical protein